MPTHQKSPQRKCQPLIEEHRPRSLDEVIGQPAAVRQISNVLARGWGGRAWWISGPSGTGKTTLARIIANEGAEGWCTIELDASQISSSWLDEAESTMHLYGAPPKGGRCWIINEAHGLRRSSCIQRLLVLLDPLPNHVCFIFTTTTEGEQLLLEDKVDAPPLLSRCQVVRLESGSKTREAFAKAVRCIAQEWDMDSQPLSDYRHLADTEDCNMRFMLQRVESGLRLPPAPPPGSKAKAETAAGNGATGAATGGCGFCGCEIPKGRKYCGTEHFFAKLHEQKRRR